MILQINIIESVDCGCWAVEIGPDEDGSIERTVFFGQNSEKRARQYVEFLEMTKP